MSRKTGWVNFYIPERYEVPLDELRGRLPGSFSAAMQECLGVLFEKYRIPFDDKPDVEQ